MVPTTTSIGETEWTQTEGDKTLEVRIPLSLPEGVRPRALTVSIKDDCILCISHNEDVLLQWRLHAAVEKEVEWSVEDTILIANLEKKADTTWPVLISLPIPEEMYVSNEEIDRMFHRFLPVLPPVKEDSKLDGTEETKKDENDDKADEADEEEEKKKDGEGDEDLDHLLEEAAAEVTGASAAEAEDESTGFAAFIKGDLENFKAEMDGIMEKLNEVEKVLLDPEENEATNQAREQKKILDGMLKLHHEGRALRSEPSTLANYIKSLQIDIQKARINVGEFSPAEEEEYASAEEEAMSATELFATGLRYLQQQDVKQSLHFLRLAAIHHNHDQSVIVLYDIYAQLGSPRGAFLLLQRALDDENPSGSANHKIGELCDRGARHFLPLFPASLYFQQRAAKFGDAAALLSIAQLWLRGTTSVSMLSEEDVESLRSMPRFHAWLQAAVDRGSGSAHVVIGISHLRGDDGFPKSYKDAKKHLDYGAKAQPGLLRGAPQLTMALEKLRVEEEGGDDSKTVASPTTLQARRTAAAAAAAAANADDADVTEVTPSMNRLNRLGGAGQGTVGMPAARSKKGYGGGAGRKAFWERASVVGVSIYGIYTLAFPIRILMIPAFYAFVESLVSFVPWLGNNNTDFGGMF